MRSERPSGFLVARVQCFGVEMTARPRTAAEGWEREGVVASAAPCLRARRECVCVSV